MRKRGQILKLKIQFLIKDLKKVFNDCLRLLNNKTWEDHAPNEMLDALNWSSFNQLCGETRLFEAWKTVHSEKYCMQEILLIKEKNKYATRSNDVTLLEQGEINKF